MEFIKGLFAKKPHEKAPDWIIAKVSIKATDLCQHLKEMSSNKQLNEGYLNLELLESKKGTLYFKVDEWKPESKTPENKAPEKPQPSNDFNDDIPF